MKSRRATTKPRKTRTYRSEIRQEQVQRTADRILDAVVERLRMGDRELSYAVIAREARVSVPTVYRHFPTQEAMFEAYVARDTSRPEHQVTKDRAGLTEGLRMFFRRFDDPNDPVGRGRLDVMWRFSRAATVPRRRATFEELLDSECPGVPEPQRTWIVELGIVLVSSAIGEAFRGYLDRNGDETADRVQLAVDALFAHARTLSRTSTPRKTEKSR